MSEPWTSKAGNDSEDECMNDPPFYNCSLAPRSSSYDGYSRGVVGYGSTMEAYDVFAQYLLDVTAAEWTDGPRRYVGRCCVDGMSFWVYGNSLAEFQDACVQAQLSGTSTQTRCPGSQLVVRYF